MGTITFWLVASYGYILNLEQIYKTGTPIHHILIFYPIVQYSTL